MVALPKGPVLLDELLVVTHLAIEDLLRVDSPVLIENVRLLENPAHDDLATVLFTRLLDRLLVVVKRLP